MGTDVGRTHELGGIADLVESIDAPELWHAGQFGVFRGRFSAEEQRRLLQEDLQAELHVSAILGAVFGSGLLLAAISLLVILSL